MIHKAARYNKLCFGIIAGILVLGILFSAANVLVVDGNSIMALMFYNVEDTWMDMYHSIQIAIAENPYDIGSIYPPMSTLYYRLLSHAFHTHDEGTWDGTSWSMRETQMGRMLVLGQTVLFCLLLAMAISTILHKWPRLKRYAIVLLALFSSPMLYLMERGNILLLALCLMGLFLAGYKSPHKPVRELALVCLALAFSIKLYPAALGLLLLRDKRWADALRLALYGVLLLLLPAFFFDGFATIGAFLGGLANEIATFGMYRVRVDVTGLAAYLFNNTQPAAFVTIARVVLCVGALFSACVLKKTWQQVAALCLLMIYLPGFSYYYVATLLIFPCIMFLADNEKRRQDMLYAVCYAGMLVVIMRPASYEPFISAVGQISPSMRLCNLSLGAFSAILIGEGIVTAVKMLRQKAAPAKI